MKRYQILTLCKLILWTTLTTGCLFNNAPEPTAVISPSTPTSQIIVETPIAPPPTEVAAVLTETPNTIPPTSTPVEIILPTETLAPAEETAVPPTAVAQDCVRPGVPEGWWYITHVVVPGDTLFAIGQSTVPPMTVDDIAAANCLTNVNAIEAGQELVVWHNPADGAVNQPIVFEENPFVKFAEYAGPLAFGQMAFSFSADGPQNFNIVSRSGNTLRFTVEKASDGSEIGAVSTIERHYLETDSRGKQFWLPEAGEYRMVVAGRPGLLLDFSLILGGLDYPALATPERIQFAAGESSQTIAGTTPVGQLNRYVFGASAGQQLELEVTENTFPVALIIEDLDTNQLYRSDFQAPPHLITIPATGDYILTVCHCASEWYGAGDYSFNIGITTPAAAVPTATPTPASFPDQPQELVFTNGINDWMFADATGTLDASGSKTFTFYIGGQRNLLVAETSGSRLSMRLEKGDGTVQVGTLNIGDRFFVNGEVNGGQFLLPETAQYLLHVTGEPGDSYEFGLTWGSPPHPVINVPERVQFAAGATSAQIVGTNEPGELDRFVFGAAAGQTVTITINREEGEVLPPYVQLEDGEQNRLLMVEGDSGQVTLPAAGDYTLIVFHPGGEVFAFGDYDFTLQIE